jgi:hypothetical protein
VGSDYITREVQVKANEGGEKMTRIMSSEESHNTRRIL